MKRWMTRSRRALLAGVAGVLLASLAMPQPGLAKAAPKKKATVKKTTAKKKAATTKKPVTGIQVTPGAGSGNAKDVDTKGILKYGVSLDITGGGAHFDPNQSAIISDLTWMQLIYGTLLKETPDGQYVPWMAKSVDLVDTKTIKLGIRTNPPLRFTDGWPYDAQAVADGLMRNRFQPATVAAQAGMHSAFRSLVTAKATDPGTVIITLKDPIAGDFLTSLANREGSIVSPKQVSENAASIEKAPIGAGPYTFLKYEPLQIISLRKNPDFFEADKWRLAGIDFVHTPSGPAGVSGLLAGAIDYYPTVPTDSADRVTSDKRFGVASGFTEFAYRMFNFCSGKPPFDNEDLRKGFQVAFDRDQMNKLVYGGLGRAAYGLWPEGHVNFNPDVKKYDRYDPAEAKRLFTAAGVTPAKPLTVDVWGTGPSGEERAFEYMQAVLDPYGITLNIHKPRDVVGEFITPQLPGVLYVPGSRTGYDKYGRVFIPGGQQALCGIARSDVMSLAKEAASYLPTDPRAIAAYKAADIAAVQHAYVAPLVQAPSIAAWSLSRVGDTPQYTAARAGLLFDSIYLRK
jgi:peptide/nickel transport system substrate-binding protein